MANNLSRKLKTVQQKHYAIVLAEDVAKPYEEMAGKLGVDIGELLSERLQAATYYTAEKPLYFDDAQRKELEALLESNFSSAQQVIDKLRVLLTVTKILSEDGASEVLLTPQQLYRLADRAQTRGKSIAGYAKELSLMGINTEIGIY